MPVLTRSFVKASLITLVVGLLIGIWQQIPGFSIPGLSPVYLHLLTFGWLTQLIFGVALWMFPVYTKEQPRGPEWLGWTIFACLNLGLLLRLIFEPLQGLAPSIVGGWMLVLSALLQWLAGVGFIINIWPRVRGK
ncbi:MAG TPA: hypothetical protein DEF43_16180 [Chloroflexus aurantiacus]|jgi:hypothetical protein|uniref:Uncharacterized protein n=1 Tax=Chloroflexus aurantiacus (strain ATCC 29366 / DSM 635 / J-10-fl) TaxID=324602 RepID=A9WE15_CHLAA|nr:MULTISPECIES: hypothetical protein [Chloroflexus]ABY35174.1 conserved hypothetical protein [Chloroflexus aurantiacus J-10-fl]RMG52374.1 MAG: hypothetical protein D6716_03755 [Chloroflexota bacterium]GIV92427.1 MAG: hypothetical protein KatS3mg056_1136 [Chloroflexus sp.]HBW68653.1 hypothetical protein [Chloroflexus aurantiacus]